MLIQLFRSLDSIKVAAARATIIWMVGVYCSLGHIIPRMLTTITKYLAWSFKSEASETKLQILNTIAKVYSLGRCLNTSYSEFNNIIFLHQPL